MNERQKKLRVSGGDLLVLILRYILCLVFPPLAVLDKGCGTVLIVFLLTLFGWLPGTVMAILICIKDNNYYIGPNNKSSGTKS